MREIFVRVSAKQITRGGKLEDIMSPFQVDVKIDEDSKLIVGKWVIFGVWGSYNEDANDVSPLTLLLDGTLDFGSEWEAQRYGKTNLRDRAISVGSYFDLTDTEEMTHTYAVSSVAILGEGKV